MPQIFDNIEKDLLSALTEAMGLSERADFCVGYFNLRGWKQVSSLVDRWPGGDGHCCRILVGMQQMPQDQLRQALNPVKAEQETDQATAIMLKRKLAQEFRDQLTLGLPTNEDEVALRHLASQIEAKKVVVKLFKGNVIVASRTSEQSLFDQRISTFDDDGGAYDQADAGGFIKLNALRMRIAENARQKRAAKPAKPAKTSRAKK